VPPPHREWGLERGHNRSQQMFDCFQRKYAFLCILANVNSRSRSLYAVAVPSVCRLSETLVHPTQPVEIFTNISSPFGTLAIH